MLQSNIEAQLNGKVRALHEIAFHSVDKKEYQYEDCTKKITGK